MSPRVRYRIIPAQPAAHLFSVETTIVSPAEAGQRFSLPCWIPGSYLVRDFARHIVSLEAHDKNGPVRVAKLDRHTWQAEPADGPLVLRALVYAWDLSVRAAHLDNTHGFFNATSLCFLVEGKEQSDCDVVLEPPVGLADHRWRVATTLPGVELDANGFGLYRAPDYDTLIDHPVEMGTFSMVSFVSFGVVHEMALTGRVRFDENRLADDCKKICDEHIAMFHRAGGAHEDAPMRRYLFLTTALGDGYGGLEHRDSTALICKRDDLPKPGQKQQTEGYRGFLGLVSHEYFHLWNVKRIKPSAFTPYRLDGENYTRNLWAFEGITSYYDDLALLRAGVVTVEHWLELVARTLTRVLRTPGRHLQSVADSSFDSWIKFYRPDENTPNSGISYYTKGALIAMALDLTIRNATGGSRSLDDVMRLLWQRYGKSDAERPGGVPEDGVEIAASEVCGQDLASFFDAYVRGTNDPPLEALLASHGVSLQLRAQEGDSDAGGKAGKTPENERGSLGVVVGGGGDGAGLAHVLVGSAAQRAGLSAGDVIVAFDGLKANRNNLTRMAQERPPGTRVRVHAFRRDELIETEVTLDAPAKDTAYLTLQDVDVAAVARRTAWLKSSVSA